MWHISCIIFSMEPNNSNSPQFNSFGGQNPPYGYETTPPPSNFSHENGQSNLKKTLLALLLLLVVANLATYFYKESKGEEVVRELPDGSIYREAVADSVVSGFPSELLIEEGAVVSQSYAIQYERERTEQPVVSYYSARSMEENVEDFGNLLRENNWQITQSADANQSLTFFYATRNTEDVNITFEERQDGLFITIAYSIVR